MNPSRVGMYIPPEEWKESAVWLAQFAAYLEPTANVEEIFYFILDLFEVGGGELTYADLNSIVIMASFYKADLKDFETVH